jgi:hypothetical protein
MKPGIRFLRVAALLSVVALQGAALGQSADFASEGYARGAAEYLRLPDNAQSASLCRAVTAWKYPYCSSKANPGLRDAVSSPTLSTTYGLMSLEQKYFSAKYAQPIGDYLVCGLSVISFGMTGFEARDNYGIMTGTFSDQETAVALSAAGKLTKNISAGITIRYLNQLLEKEYANGASFDCGATYDPFSFVTIGASLLHFPSLLWWSTGTHDVVLSTARVGLCWHLLDTALNFETDVAVTECQPLEFSGGLEYVLFKIIALRGGIATSSSISERKSRMPDFALGIGIHYQGVAFDYAFRRPATILDPSHWFSLDIDLARAVRIFY